MFLNLFLNAQQSEIDSIKTLLNIQKEDTSKFKLYTTLINLNTKDNISYLDSCDIIANRINNPLYFIRALSEKGSYFAERSENKKSLSFFLKALEISTEIGHKEYMSKCFNNIANRYDVMGIYDKALYFHFKALKLKEELNLVKKIYISKINIAIVYYNLKQYNQSIEYNTEALKDCIKYKDKINEANIYLNLGNNYSDNGKLEKGILYYEKAAELAKKVDEPSIYAISNAGLAGSYILIKDYIKAKKYATITLNISDENEFNEYSSSARIILGEINIATNRYDVAEKQLLEGLKIAKENDMALNQRDAYLNLSNLYSKQEKFDQSLTYYKLFSSLKDSLINDNKTQLLSNLQENFEIEKKDKENKLLQTQNQLSRATIKQQKIVTYFIIGGLLIVSCLAFFVFKGLKKQRKANKIISLQKLEVERQKTAVEEQKQKVEEHQKEILDSIHYAKRIQTALLPNEKYIKRKINELNK